jgi:hypothetical protein
MRTCRGRALAGDGVTNSKLKIKAATAQEICAGFTPSTDAQAYLKPGIAPVAFVDALAAAALFADAVEFYARALPKREAVWWACVCARDLPLGDTPPFVAAIKAAEAWVYRPSEENRRAAESAANAIKASHPARWAAMAAFWSAGSMSPPGAPEVKPAEDFTAKAVSGAVQMAAGLDPAAIPVRRPRFLTYARDIAHGGNGRPQN